MKITLEQIKEAAQIAATKTKGHNNPPTTEREIELGLLAFINGALWMQKTITAMNKIESGTQFFNSRLLKNDTN